MIINKKQFDVKNYEIDFCGRPLRMQVGKMAELCNAAVLIQYGETTILCTVTAPLCRQCLPPAL